MGMATMAGTAGEAMNGATIDEVIWNDWHPVAALDALDAARAAGGSNAVTRTRLLGVDIGMLALPQAGARPQDSYRVWRLDDQTPCHAQARYGVLWVCAGEPRRDILAIPEADEPDRRLLHAGAFRVHVSGLRAVENFLDMGHFPFVHTGYLGVEPYTEVAPYRIERDELSDELYAHDCRFYQPRAAMTAGAALDQAMVQPGRARRFDLRGKVEVGARDKHQRRLILAGSSDRPKLDDAAELRESRPTSGA